MSDLDARADRHQARLFRAAVNKWGHLVISEEAAAELLGVSRQAVNKRARSGRLPSVTVAGRRLYLAPELTP